MTLQPGTQLGPYEIQRLIGRGGMGEVYQATDTRLHRPVAIKVLAEELTSSIPAMERLQREARTASILNHPNICTIYDVGVTTPSYIAMELLEGESLQQRLRRGPLDVHALLDIAIATADGLAAAHSHGFIHRDVKPANIFLTAHGPKLLDFGLAKPHVSTSLGGWSGDNTRPAEAEITDSGATVGTVAYMSPEQLRGKEIDGRTDVFSLGLVLYEMATGRPAFTGKTSAEVSGAILYEPCVSPIEIEPGIPARLNDAILRTLEKDRDDRYQTAADLRADLRRLRRELDSHASHQMATPTAAASGLHDRTRPRAPHRGPGVKAVVASVVLLVGALVGLALYLRPGLTDPSSSLISIADIELARLPSTQDAERPAIAPDGNYLAFIRRQNGRDSLHVRQMATPETADIVKPEPEVSMWGATVSADGGFVDYVRRAGGGPFELWRVPFLGGTSRRVLENVHSPIGWSPDGRRFAFIRGDFARATTGVVIADASGNNERVLVERQRPAQYVSLMIASRPSIAPAWSPNGRLLAIAGAGARTDPEEGDVAVIDVETGALRTIPLPSSYVRGLTWFDDNGLILDAALPGSPLQLHQLSYPDGKLSPLTRDVNDYDGISVAADRRTLVGSRRERRTDLAILDTTGRAVTAGPDITATAAQTDVVTINWAADRVVYANWAWAPGSTPQQLLRDAHHTTTSPDGRTFVFNRPNGLWKADSSGGREMLLTSGEAYHPVVTPDNRWIIFLSSRTGQQSPWIVSIDGGEPRQLLNVFAGSPGVDISPDGTRLVFPARNTQTGEPTALMCELPDCTRQRYISTLAGTRFRWTPDGRRIAYIDPEARTNIWTMPVDGGPPTQLTHFDERAIVDFDWSPDGKRLVVARRLDTNDIVVLKGLRRP